MSLFKLQNILDKLSESIMKVMKKKDDELENKIKNSLSDVSFTVQELQTKYNNI